VLQELYRSGRIIDLIALCIVLEALLLAWWWRSRGAGLPPREFLGAMLAGALLLFAVRSALVGAPWLQTAAWLGAALLGHVADLALRWRRMPTARSSSRTP
jgi:hypothetical protein